MRQAIVDDYLKAMYAIRETQQDMTQEINSIGVANLPNIKKSNVLVVIKKLSKLDYIKMISLADIKEGEIISVHNIVYEYGVKHKLGTFKISNGQKLKVIKKLK